MAERASHPHQVDEDAAIHIRDFSNENFVMEELGYKSCIETNNPTPLLLALNAKNLLSQCQLTLQEKENFHLFLIKATLQPVGNKLTKEAQNDLDTTIRFIEVQVLLRFQFWASLGHRFAMLYKLSGCKRRRKTVLNDIIDFLSFAALKLPENRPFSLFLNECLSTAFHNPLTLLPKTVFQTIYSLFEVENPENPEQEDYVPFFVKEKQLQNADEIPGNADSENTKAPTSLFEPGTQRDHTRKKDSANSTVPASKKYAQPSLLPQAVALVAPVSRKRNSLLAGGNYRFVGSHFNTNLVNMNTLFREVKTQTKQPTSNSSLKKNSARGDGVRVVNNNRSGRAGGKRKQCFHVADSANAGKKKAIQETPSHRHKTSTERKDASARQVVFAARIALKRQD